MRPTNADWRTPARSLKRACVFWKRGDYAAYNQHCVDAKSDARDTGQVYRWLRGDMRGDLLDISVTDASDLYGAPKPTWVAGALIEWKMAD